MRNCRVGAGAVAVAVMMAGCATSKVMETGKNEYTLQSRALTPVGAVEDGITAANKACGEKGLRARIIKMEPVSVWDMYHRRQVTFACE